MARVWLAPLGVLAVVLGGCPTHAEVRCTTPPADADGDGISDDAEGRGSRDTDGDGTPDWQDADSDGDTLPDVVEAGNHGDTCAQPADTDGDGAFDFQDRDADNDGLADRQEDLDGDGLLDPGESDPRDSNTDDADVSDVVEWAAGTDQQVPSVVDGIYVVTGFGDPPHETPLDLEVRRPVDVFFLYGTSAVSEMTIDAVRAQLPTASIGLLNPDTRIGVGSFQDFDVSPFGSPGDAPFVVHQPITADLAAVTGSMSAWSPAGAGDLPGSGWEAIYRAMTDDTVGLRPGAMPVLVYIADQPSHDAVDYAAAGISAHARAEAVSKLLGAKATLIAVTANPALRMELDELTQEVGSAVMSTIWGPGETFCHTGPGGAPRPPMPSGLCPLVFETYEDGEGLGYGMAEAIAARNVLDAVSLELVPDPTALPALDTSSFVELALPQVPPGAWFEDGVLHDIPSGWVSFTLAMRNQMIEDGAESQLFRLTARLFGDGALRDEIDVFIIVPAVSI